MLTIKIAAVVNGIITLVIVVTFWSSNPIARAIYLHESVCDNSKMKPLYLSFCLFLNATSMLN